RAGPPDACRTRPARPPKARRRGPIAPSGRGSLREPRLPRRRRLAPGGWWARPDAAIVMRVGPVREREGLPPLAALPALTAAPYVGAEAGRMRTSLPVLASLAVLLAVAATSGGYFPVQWGWSALAFAWIAATVLVVSRVGLARVEWLWLGSLL